MSNAQHKRLMAERAKVRAFTHTDARPAIITVTGVSIVRTGRWINKRAGWIKNGERGGCTMRVREVETRVNSRQITNPRHGHAVEIESGIGERPGYSFP